MSWWTKIWTTRAQEWTAGEIKTSSIPVSSFESDASYVRINLQSMHLVDLRRGLVRLRPVVHAYTSLAHLKDGTAEFHVITTPTNLKEVDAKHLDRVVTETQPIVGPIPYRGGAVTLEIGLFSIGADSFAAPFLGLLEGVSKAVGNSFITSAAESFAQPLVDGINGLGTAVGESTLEIGISKTFTAGLTTGCFFVCRAPNGELDEKALVLDDGFRLRTKTGNDLPYPYLVFTIERSVTREDWARIPDILEAYNRLRAAITTRASQDQIDALLETFALVVRWSPDLLDADAEKLVARVRGMVSPRGPKAITATTEGIPPFAAIGMYS